MVLFHAIDRCRVPQIGKTGVNDMFKAFGWGVLTAIGTFVLIQGILALAGVLHSRGLVGVMALLCGLAVTVRLLRNRLARIPNPKDQLAAEMEIKRILACSVSEITFNDSNRIIRVVCDTEHGPVRLVAIQAIQDMFQATVTLESSEFEHEVIIVLAAHPKRYPPKKIIGI